MKYLSITGIEKVAEYEELKHQIMKVEEQLQRRLMVNDSMGHSHGSGIGSNKKGLKLGGDKNKLNLSRQKMSGFSKQEEKRR